MQEQQQGARVLEDDKPGTAENLTPTSQVGPGKRRAAAVPRRITAELDAVDSRILELREQGLTMEATAQKISAEGLATYQPKSLESRYVRIRKILAAKEDERLDDDMSDWHLDEDEVLNDCYRAVDEQIRKEVAAIEAKRWKKVAGAVSDHLRRQKYSSNACHQRFEDLQNAAALLPIELDPNPTARRQATQDRIALAKQRRADAEAADQAARDEKMNKSKSDKLLKAETNRIKIQHGLRMQQLAQSRAVKQASVRAEKEAARAALQGWLTYCKSQTEWDRIKERFEDYTLKCLRAGVSVGSVVPQARANRARAGAEIVIDDGGDAYSTSEEEQKAYQTLLASGRVAPSQLQRSSTSATPNPTREGTLIRPPIKKDKETIKIRVTPESLLNPRSVMTMDELKSILTERKLTPCGLNETHPQLVARMHAHDLNLNTTNLDNVLKSKFVSTAGKKDFKVRKLQEQDARESAAGQAGINAQDRTFKLQYEGYQGHFAYLLDEDL
ncbi:hypothetical protein K431DRAFT_116624 [Polychaeton citri CBS 116435]|uniref:DUF7626 domain-containing protein n=1 Tax=Polychaeton citri CBS 116435 TaxID=1314669 RepID=A0A9P4QHI6_9PEZI|nr:hypothetical protein K431DRAFT_116624 [Polychaeton citri CBS 116435]